jgi:hypothetical protein
MVNIIVLLCDGDSADRIMLEFKPWALDSAGKELFQRIKKEAMCTSVIVVVNSVIALLSAVLFFLPVENDEELFFALYLFKRWFPVYGFVSSWIYRSTFFVLAYVLITPIHECIYTVQHVKFQLFLFLFHIKNITDVTEYNSMRDHNLLTNENFQLTITQRLKFCVKRHAELLQ